MNDDDYNAWAVRLRAMYPEAIANRILVQGPHAATIREALTRLTADEHYRSADENSLHRSALASLDALVALARRADDLENLMTDMAKMFDDERKRAEAAEERASQLEHERDDLRAAWSSARGEADAAHHATEQARREADQLRERCPVCTHEWRQHDPEDGKCDAGSDDLGECPCGRDLSFHRVRNAAISLAALAGVQAKEQ